MASVERVATPAWRRMAAFAIVAGLVLAAMPALACSCFPETAEQGFRRAGAIFIGTVQESRMSAEPRGRGSAETRVVVEQVIKGAPGTEIVIAHGTEGSTCGVQFRAGQRLTFMTGVVRDGRTGTGYCSQMFVHYRARDLEPVYQRFRALVAEADQRMAREPASADAAIARASLLEDWGDRDRALQGYAAIAGRWPDDARGWLGQGRVLFGLDRMAEARAPLERAVALDPANADARRMFDQARLRTGDASVVASLDFRGLQLANGDFSSRDLTGRDFSGARLNRVSFRGADLSGSRMDRVDFHTVDFSNARLQRVALVNSFTYEVNLADADLTGAELTRTTFQGARLNRTNLTGVSAAGANFEQSRIADSSFANANLAGGSFWTARLENVDFSGARLDGANLRSVRLRGVNLASATLDAADMRAVTYDCATRFPAGFEAAQHGALLVETSCLAPGARRTLEGQNFNGTLADFSDLDLSGVSFRRVNFAHTKFWRANLRGADLSESVGADNFTGADLTNTNFTNARGVRGFYGVGGPAPVIDGMILRGVELASNLLTDPGNPQFTIPDFTRANLEGMVVNCVNLAHSGAGRGRDSQIAAIRALEPRRRGIILGGGCDRVPELADVR